MVEKECKENQVKFFKGVEKLDFLPLKYFEAYLRHGKETIYDHGFLWRIGEYEYLVFSPYNIDGCKQLEEEGFIKIPPMYQENCTSYMKAFIKSRKWKPVEAENPMGELTNE